MLLPGLGAVSTTLVAGVHLIRQGPRAAVRLPDADAELRLGKRTHPRLVPIKELVPLAELSDLVFGGWDIFPDNAYESAEGAGVVPAEMLAQVRRSSRRVTPVAGRLRARLGAEPRRHARESGADEDAPRRGADRGTSTDFRARTASRAP